VCPAGSMEQQSAQRHKWLDFERPQSFREQVPDMILR
jgi:hypothetical protein